MRQRPTLEPLEPRLLFSADTPSALAAALVGTPDAEHRLLDAEGEFAVQSALQEIVFIDARTPDSAQLVEDLAAQSGRDVELIVLDAERNGLEQISAALAGRENVAALHFIAHGGEGVVQLGNALVTAETLQVNPGLVEAWSKALSADADILLYGCDVAATAQGRLLADTLARLTGADVSASNDATGHASLGGDWNLEYATGAIDVAVAPSESAQDAWSHLLPSVVMTSYDPPFANMTDNAYEIAGGTTYAQSFSHVSWTGTYTVNQIDLVLYRNAATTGADINVELQDTLNNVLASGSVSRAELGTSENWVVVSLDATATLTDGTPYFIVVKGTGGGDIFIGIDDAGLYLGGNLSIDGTPELLKDMAFRVVSTDGPVVDLNGNPKGQDTTVTFTEQTPVPIAKNSASISDPDSANLTSLTATLTARPDGDAVESLSATVTGGLAVNYDQATGVLSITGSAPVATYQAILRGIQYNNTSDAPTTTNRVVSVVVSDGTTPSAARTSVITVTAVNDAPVLAGAGGTLAYTEGDAATAIEAALTIGDVDDLNIESATVTISAGLASSEDVLGFTSAFGITGIYTAATGVLALSGSATLAEYEQVLESVTYQNTNTADPSTAARTITWVVNDGTDSSVGVTSTITLGAVNDAPLNDVPGGQTTNEDTALLFSAGDGNAISIADDAGTNPVQVALTGTNGAITLASTVGLTFSVGDGTADATMTFTGTVAAINAALNGVSFLPSANFNGSASLSISTDDQGNTGSGGALSDLDAVAITVNAVNDAPVLNAAQLTVSEGGTTVLAAADFNITDPDNTAFTYTVSGLAGGSFEVFNGATWNAAASFTTAQLTAGTVRFVHDGNEVGPSFSVTANDGAANSNTLAATVIYTPVNDAPVLAGAGGTLAYAEGDAATAIDATLTISDVDDLNIESATATISAGLVSAEDVLSFTSAFGITGSYTAATGVLALSGSATLAEYEQVLESVTYQNTNTGNPSTGARTITWVVNDGADNSAGATSTVTLAAVNDAPVNAVPGAQATNEDAALVFSAGNGNAISMADVDAGAGPVQVVLTGTNGAITLAGIAGLTFSVGDGAADAAMTFSGSVGAINAALNGMSFTPSAEFSGAASVSIDIDDQGNAGAGGALSDSDAVAITVNMVNDAPTVSASGGTTAFTGGGGAVLVDAALAVGDVDDATLASAMVWISGGFQAGQDMLGFSNDPATMGNIAGSYDAATGVLSLSSAGATATVMQWQAALRSVTYDNSAAMPIVGPRSVSFDVSDGNSYGPVASHSVTVNPAPVVPPDPGPPPVVPPPVVPPPVVIAPPPVTPPPTPAPQPTQPAAPGRPAGAAASEESTVPIQGMSVDIAERPHNPAASASSSAGAAPALRLAAYGTVTASVELANGDLLAELTRQADSRSSSPFQSGEKGRSAGAVVLPYELESMRETLREQNEIQSRGTVVLAAGSLSMTLAYLLWLIRGGALVASALSALPAWRILDPLPVLSRASDDEDEEEVDEQDDQAIASFADEPVGARQ